MEIFTFDYPIAGVFGSREIQAKDQADVVCYFFLKMHNISITQSVQRIQVGMDFFQCCISKLYISMIFIGMRAEISGASITSTSSKIKWDFPQHIVQRGPATAPNLIYFHNHSLQGVPVQFYSAPLLVTAALQSLQVLGREVCQVFSA